MTAMAAKPVASRKETAMTSLRLSAWNRYAATGAILAASYNRTENRRGDMRWAHVVLLSMLSVVSAAQAQEKPADYPRKPIRIVVGIAPAGGLDLMTPRAPPSTQQ